MGSSFPCKWGGSPSTLQATQPSKMFFPTRTVRGTCEDSQSVSSKDQLSASASRPRLPLGEPSRTLEPSVISPSP